MFNPFTNFHPGGAVSSVAGRSGAVTLAQADISGLTTADTVAFSKLALGGATIGANALAVTGAAAISGNARVDGYISYGGNGYLGATFVSGGEAGELGFSFGKADTSNVGVALFSSGHTKAGVSINDTAFYSWNTGGGTKNTTISRVSAGVIQLGTTTSNALGSLLLTNLTMTGLFGGPSTAAAAVAQTLGAQGSSAASETGPVFTVNGSIQTGTTSVGGDVFINPGTGTTSNGYVKLGTTYVAGDPATTGYILIKDSTGTIYKIPALAA